MSYIEVAKNAVEFGTYTWQLFQVESYHGEADIPCALFFHEEDAKAAYDNANNAYKTIRFVLTNVRTGESIHG